MRGVARGRGGLFLKSQIKIMRTLGFSVIINILIIEPLEYFTVHLLYYLEISWKLFFIILWKFIKQASENKEMERWNHLTTPSIARVFRCFWSPPLFLYVKKEELGIGCLSSVYRDSDLKYKFAVFFRSSKDVRNISPVANVRPVFEKQRRYLLFSSIS